MNLVESAEENSDCDEFRVTEPLERKIERKRRRTKRQSKSLEKRVKGKRGALEQIAEMPLDIIHEVTLPLRQYLKLITNPQILSHLAPSDLLNLSRTNKLLRSVLMRRSNASVWRAALNRICAPKRPNQVNEAYYTKFLFDLFCDVRRF